MNFNDIEVIEVDFKESKSKKIKNNVVSKVRKIKRKAKQKVDWCVEHPDGALLIVTIVGSCIGIGQKVVRTVKPSATEKMLKRQRCSQYDNQLNVWWKLKREMTTAEKLEFESRRKAGESVSEALRKMGLLKK